MLINVTSGPYLGIYIVRPQVQGPHIPGVWNCGITRSGFRLSWTTHGHACNQTTAYGATLIESIHLGADWTLSFVAMEYPRVGPREAAWPWGTFNPIPVMTPAFPVRMGRIGRTATGASGVMILVAASGTPAAGSPATLTAAYACLRPGTQVGMDFDSSNRTIPITLDLFPYDYGESGEPFRLNRLSSASGGGSTSLSGGGVSGGSSGGFSLSGGGVGGAALGSGRRSGEMFFQGVSPSLYENVSGIPNPPPSPQASLPGVDPLQVKPNTPAGSLYYPGALNQAMGSNGGDAPSQVYRTGYPRINMDGFFGTPFGGPAGIRYARISTTMITNIGSSEQTSEISSSSSTSTYESTPPWAEITPSTFLGSATMTSKPYPPPPPIPGKEVDPLPPPGTGSTGGKVFQQVWFVTT